MPRTAARAAGRGSPGHTPATRIPYIGNLFQLGPSFERFFAAYPALYHELGSDTIRIEYLGSESISTRCPECAAAILDGDNFRKPATTIISGEAGLFLGDGMISMEDETPGGEALHRAVRTAVAPAFGANATTRLAREFVRGSDGAVRRCRLTL